MPFGKLAYSPLSNLHIGLKWFEEGCLSAPSKGFRLHLIQGVRKTDNEKMDGIGVKMDPQSAVDNISLQVAHKNIKSVSKNPYSVSALMSLVSTISIKAQPTSDYVIHKIYHSETKIYPLRKID